MAETKTKTAVSVAVLAVLLLASATVVFAADVMAKGMFERKWLLLNSIDFKASDENCAKAESLLRTAHGFGYNGVMISSWHGLDMLHTKVWKPERIERLMRVKRCCDELGMEIGVCVWTFGYARYGFFNIDNNLAAASPVFDTRYRVEGGRCVHIPRPERELLGNGRGLVHSPRRDDDIGRISVPVSPRRSYRLRIKATAEGGGSSWPIVAAARRPGAKDDFIEHRVFNVRSGAPEQTFDLYFSSLAETNVTIVCHGYNGHHPGEVAVSSMALSETPPRLVIRRSGTPVRVRRVRDKKTFKEGVDYAEIPKAISTWPTDLTKFTLRPLPGGAMKDGDEVSVDCFCAFPAWGKWSSACMASPEVFKEMDASAAAIAKLLNPKVWELSFDEVRQGGGCVDCRRTGDMAHVYARCVEKAMETIRRYRPDAEIFIYNDMVDPFYMTDDGKYAGLYSSMKGVWDLLPRDIGIDCWTDRTRETAPKFFAGRGHPVFISTYYDDKTLKRSREWRDTAMALPGVKGVIYSTYADDWSMLKPFAELMDKGEERAKSPH